MTERITKLMTPLPPLPASTSDPSSSATAIPDLLQPNWSLPVPKFKNKNDMLAYAQKLLQPKSSTATTRRKSAAAAAAAAEESTDSNVIKVQEEYPVDYDEIRHQAASMSQSTYRINQFLKLADTFITQHLARTQAQLSQITASSSTSGGGSRNASGSGTAKERNAASEEDASNTTRALLAGNNAAQSVKSRGQDARSLLRAISRADTSKKK